MPSQVGIFIYKKHRQPFFIGLSVQSKRVIIIDGIRR